MSKHLQKKIQIDLNSFFFSVQSYPKILMSTKAYTCVFLFFFLQIINVHVAKMSALH